MAMAIAAVVTLGLAGCGRSNKEAAAPLKIPETKTRNMGMGWKF